MPHRAPILFAVVSSAADRACAQCEPEWLPTPPAAALNDYVSALASFQGDLIAGGQFTEAGGTPAEHIARWDGERWWPLGSGLGNIPASLFVHEQHLIASGSIASAGGHIVHGIARWDGRDWSPMSQPGPWAPWIMAGDLVVHAGGLIAGGDHTFFTTTGHFHFHHVARWNGREWRPLGPDTVPSTVFDLLPHAGELFAAVNHKSGPPDGAVVRWDGRQWAPTAPLLVSWGMPQVTDLAVHNQQVVAAGPGAPVQTWDGSTWTELGAPAPTGRGLLLFQGELFVGLNGSPIVPAATWNGSAWRYLPPGPVPSVYATTLHGNQLAVGSLDWPFWALWGCACYADCDNSGAPTVADFECFQTQFVLGRGYADCDNSGALTVADFGCFQAKFVAGCP